MGAVTATLPAEYLLASMGRRSLFDLVAVMAAATAAVIYVVVPDHAPANLVKKEPVLVSLRRIYSCAGFWRLAPLSPSVRPGRCTVSGPHSGSVTSRDWTVARWCNICLPWLSRFASARHGSGLAVEHGDGRLHRGQMALILRWPLPSCIPWAIIAAVGAATIVSFAVLAEHIPRELAGRANGALNVFHTGGAFVLQYATGIVLQQWESQAGRYPEVAYQAGLALNVVLQIAAWIWFLLPRIWMTRAARWQQETSLL